MCVSACDGGKFAVFDEIIWIFCCAFHHQLDFASYIESLKLLFNLAKIFTSLAGKIHPHKVAQTHTSVDR